MCDLQVYPLRSSDLGVYRAKTPTIFIVVSTRQNEISTECCLLSASGARVRTAATRKRNFLRPRVHGVFICFGLNVFFSSSYKKWHPFDFVQTFHRGSRVVVGVHKPNAFYACGHCLMWGNQNSSRNLSGKWLWLRECYMNSVISIANPVLNLFRRSSRHRKDANAVQIMQTHDVPAEFELQNCVGCPRNTQYWDLRSKASRDGSRIAGCCRFMYIIFVAVRLV